MSNELSSPNDAVVVVQPQMLPAITNAEPLDMSRIQSIAQGLDTAEVIDVNLATAYWSPEKVLDKKRLIFLEVKEMLTDDIADATKKKLLRTAVFVENVDGTLVRTSNASKKLVGILDDSHLASGTRLEVTYLGKVKNKSNNYTSDSWAVKLLSINI